jgi:Tfp pilus assembly protein PilF
MTSVSPARKTIRAKGKKRDEAATPSNSFPWRDRPTLGFCLALVALVLLAYSRVTPNDFVSFDDYKYIVDNAHVNAGLKWATVTWAFSSFEEANYHPLTWLSHALDCTLFGLNPAAHHWVNVSLHALCAVVLFLFLLSATGSRWRSLMVAALFALHPINVESVAWAAERKNVLSMLFFLLALYAYVAYVRNPSRGRYAAVAGLYLLALLAKPQVITFPFLLLLLDYWPLRRIDFPPDQKLRSGDLTPSPAKLVLEKVPFFAMSAASAVVTMIAQAAVRSVAHYSLLLRLETATISYVRYLGKAFWPVNLAALYPHPTRLYPVWQASAAAFLLLLITVLVLRQRDHRYLAVGWFWFLGSMVPMIGLVQVGAQAMADRYAYIPFIGLFVAIVWLVADAVAEWNAGQNQARQISPRWLAVPALSCLLALGVLTSRQLVYWHDTESFWRHTLALTEGNFFAQDSLAAFLHKHGRTDEAIEHYRAALAIWPDDMPANLNLGAYEYEHGNLPAAIERFQVVALRAGYPSLRAKAYQDLGGAYRQLGDLDKAKQYFETSLQLLPDQPGVMVMLGLIAQKNGDLAEAVRQYRSAAALQHNEVNYLLLAQALQLQGRADEANAISQRVAQTSPNLGRAQKMVESLLAGK